MHKKGSVQFSVESRMDDDGDGGGGNDDNAAEQFMINKHKSQKCCTKRNVLRWFKNFISFMISRVGLMILMVGYVLAGGLIFEALESRHETEALRLSESVMEQMLFRVYKQIENNSTLVRDQMFYHFLKNEITYFSDFFTNGTLNGTLTGNIDPQWDFFGSVFYCLTLVSTIGYGHITCKTKIGKIFTIFYSSIGIPLMMLFLANTGSSTAAAFKFTYLKLTTFKTNYKLRKLKKDKSLSLPFGENLDYFDNNSNIKGGGDSTNLSEIIYQNQDEFIYENSNYIKNEFLAPNKAMTLPRKLSFNKKMANISENPNIKSEITNSPKKMTIDSSKKEKKSSKKKNASDKRPNSITIGIRNFEISKEASENLIKTNSNSIETLAKETNKTPSPKNQADAIKRINELIDTKSQAEDTETNYESKSNLNVDIESEEENNTYLLDDIFVDQKKVSDALNEKNLLPTPATMDEQCLNEKDTQIQVESSAISNSRLSSKKSKKFKGIARSFKWINRKAKNEENGDDENIEKDKSASKPTPPQQEKNNKGSSLKEYPRKNFDDTKEREFKKSNFNRSVMSYDYAYGRNPKGNVNFKSKQPFIYNKKQLHLIYQQFKQERQKKIGVPMLLTLLILPCHWIVGMFLFSSIENWNKLDAFYFCFITFFTIGFGDFIPGSTLFKDGNRNNLYMSALYIFAGLILFAMVFNLISHQLKIKIKALARKIGLTNC